VKNGQLLSKSILGSFVQITISNQRFVNLYLKN